MHCWECPYTNQIQRKYGVTTHCNLEPTNMDVSFNARHQKNNTLCPFVCKRTRFEGVNYDKYIDEKIEKWIEEKQLNFAFKEKTEGEDSCESKDMG